MLLFNVMMSLSLSLWLLLKYQNEIIIGELQTKQESSLDEPWSKK